MKPILFIVVVCILVSSVLCDNWALLIAASSTYDNYRHQADICHAYHVLHNHGIPDERIVVMMYDDIANNSHNPYPGNIINEPNGTNLYPGVLKDYTGDDVNPEVFVKVLSGDEKGIEKLLGRKGKVIKSGPNDYIFVNFVALCAPSLIGFPKGVLRAKELNDVIVEMYKHKQYKAMMIYMEGCETASMFDGILWPYMQVYVTTSSAPLESSYACYWDAERKTFLGDVYSVNWMNNSDVENLSRLVLFQQYQMVKSETDYSTVMQYGDLSLTWKTVSTFMGGKSARSRKIRKYNPNTDAIPSEDVPLAILRRRIETATGQEKIRLEEAYNNLLKKKKEVLDFFQTIVNRTSLSKENSKFPRASLTCYEDVVETIISYCPGMNLTQNGIALKTLPVIQKLCEKETGASFYKFLQMIRQIAEESSICK